MWRGLIVNTFVICLGMIPAVAQERDQTGHIIVTGNGDVQAAPDTATVTLGVTHESRDAKEAMSLVNEDVRKLFERLAELGVQPRDVQTSSLRLDPLWRDRSRSTPQEAPQIVGFVARNELSIRLRDMERLGEVLGILVEDGANQLSGISFSVRDPEPLLDSARRAAVSDAQRKAQLYAQAAGVGLGAILQISEPGAGPAPGPVFTARAEAVPVAAGELNFSAQVNIVFAIAE